MSAAQRNRRGGGGSQPQRRRSQRQRFSSCRVCLGRVLPADGLACAKCAAPVHRQCAQVSAWKQLDGGDQGESGGGGGHWICASCGISSDSDDDDSDSSQPVLPAGTAVQASMLAQPAQPPAAVLPVQLASTALPTEIPVARILMPAGELAPVLQVAEAAKSALAATMTAEARGRAVLESLQAVLPTAGGNVSISATSEAQISEASMALKLAFTATMEPWARLKEPLQAALSAPNSAAGEFSMLVVSMLQSVYASTVTGLQLVSASSDQAAAIVAQNRAKNAVEVAGDAVEEETAAAARSTVTTSSDSSAASEASEMPSGSTQGQTSSSAASGDPGQSVPAKRMRPAAEGAPEDAPEGPVCPICQHTILCGASKPETCEHVFCFDCLTRWRRGSNSCPLDRTPFNAVMVSLFAGQSPVRLPMPPVSEAQVQQQLLQHDEAFEFDMCNICRIQNRPEFENLVLCDHCESAFHVACLSPIQQRLLDDQAGLDLPWFCGDCAQHHQLP